jgi:hypothetical protein
LPTLLPVVRNTPIDIHRPVAVENICCAIAKLARNPSYDNRASPADGFGIVAAIFIRVKQAVEKSADTAFFLAPFPGVFDASASRGGGQVSLYLDIFPRDAFIDQLPRSRLRGAVRIENSYD